MTLQRVTISVKKHHCEIYFSELEFFYNEMFHILIAYLSCYIFIYEMYGLQHKHRAIYVLKYIEICVPCVILVLFLLFFATR